MLEDANIQNFNGSAILTSTCKIRSGNISKLLVPALAAARRQSNKSSSLAARYSLGPASRTRAQLGIFLRGPQTSLGRRGSHKYGRKDQNKGAPDLRVLTGENPLHYALHYDLEFVIGTKFWPKKLVRGSLKI